MGGNRAAAAEAPVGLGTAASFAVLGGTTVTNTGPSVISGDVGLSPGTAITGFPPGIVNGTTHATDAVAAQAQIDTTTAYNDAAGRASTATVSADLAGQTLVSGVYSGGTLGLTGTVTLDAQGDPNAVFIFQSASTLITASSSVVALINGASACNVFWQVGSSATLGTNSTFVGTILALTSIAATTGVTIDGRLLARNGEVTLDTNTITSSTCTTTPTTTTTIAPTTTAVLPTPTVPAGGIPKTGPPILPQLRLACGLVLVGGVVMAVRRRNHT
ncbi:MAG TPA: ice-binding family protein [Ilumatobacteraceae bacterium]